MEECQLIIPDVMNHFFSSESEKNVARSMMEYLFYDKKLRTTPQTWQDAEILIRFLKRDVWQIDDEQRDLGNEAITIYSLIYTMEHLTKLEILEVLHDFFAQEGQTRLIDLFSEKLHASVSDLIITQEKRLVTKKDVVEPDGLEKVFSYPSWVEYDDEAFQEICRQIYDGEMSDENIQYVLGATDDFVGYDKWFSLCKHILLTTQKFETFYIAGDILNIIWMTIPEDDKETGAWMKDQVFEIFWKRVGGVWPLLHISELVKDDDETKILLDSIGWLKSLDDLKERLPELPSDFELQTGDAGRYVFDDAMEEFRLLMKHKKVSIEEIDKALMRAVDESWDTEDAKTLSEFMKEYVIPKVKDKDFLNYIKKSLKHVQEKARRVECERRVIAKMAIKDRQAPDSEGK